MNTTIKISLAALVLALLTLTPVKVVWNTLDSAVRATLISGNKAVKTTTTVNKGFPGAGWTPSVGTWSPATGAGPASVSLTKSICQTLEATASTTNGWAWFADGNGDGDTSDGDDGVCVATTTTTSTSWNGALEMASTSISSTQTATGGSSNTIVKTGAGWVTDAYKNTTIKILSGTAVNCWGRIKSNTSDTITIYGSWLTASYASNCGTPNNTSGFRVYNENRDDNTFIGDYTCTDVFPYGRVVHNSYPTPALAGAGVIALEVADCLDGRRDLLPAESDRAVISGTATGADATSLTDTSADLVPNLWIGQKLLITGGTGRGSSGIIESNASTTISVASWTSTAPASGSSYKIIYVLPLAGSSTGKSEWKNKGPLTPTVLADWKGTRLPTSGDFFGYCGVKVGDGTGSPGNSYYYSSNASPNTALGNYGGNAGRGKNPSPLNNFLNLSNTSNEWLSEQSYSNSARFAGTYACSYVSYVNVYGGYRFRALFRP